MKIHSRFRDYYDSVRVYGADPNLHYVRETKPFLDEIPTELMPKQVIPRSSSLLEEVVLIGFCGFLYPAWKVCGQWAYNSDQIAAELGSRTKLPDPDAYDQWPRKHRQRALEDFENSNWYWSNVFSRKNVDACIENLKRRDYTSLFAYLNVPVFCLEIYKGYDRPREKILNPPLQGFDFYLIKDPYTAFQDLSMFMGGVLAQGGPKLIEISDQDMRDKKGFDNMSFKNVAPGTKKLRRKKNREKKRRKNKKSMA